MRRLDEGSFARARDFMLGCGAPLARARFRFEFEGGPKRDVLAALAAFQNDDGGFGNGLEPDFRLPASSPMATSVAFIIAREIGATARAVGIERTPDIVKRGVCYLADSYDPSLPGWRAVPLEVNEHAHAPWWSRSPESWAREIPAAEWGNPNAELTGVLVEHAALLSPDRIAPDLIERAVQHALNRLAEAPSPVDPYVALSYLRLAEVAASDVRESILARLQSDARNILDLDRETLEASHFPPYWLAPEPDAPLASALEDAIAWDLDRQIARQTEAGCWDPPWSWGPLHPDVWRAARDEWRAELTVRTLLALRAYDRIA